MHEGQAGFPIESQPFVTMARHVGGGVREVLQQCRQLAGAGLDHGIQVQWGPLIERVRWRISSSQAVPLELDLAGEIARLPGVTNWTVLEDVLQTTGDTPLARRPRVWFDLVARDIPCASAQLRQLRTRVPQLAWWAHRPAPGASPDAAPCGCNSGCGPCEDPALAALCERGLPVVARPYRVAAGALGRSERDVVLTLRRWQQQHRLLNMSMQTSDDPPECLQLVAAWHRFELSASSIDRLSTHPGIVDVESCWLPGWNSAVVAGFGPVAALYRALKSCELPWPEGELWAVRTCRVRHAPLLFGQEASALRVADRTP